MKSKHDLSHKLNKTPSRCDDLENQNNCSKCNTDDYKKTILYNQACMSSCEAQLFCEATSRLSYELYVAKDLCQVQQIVETISCLFSASALKDKALAEVIKSFNITYTDCHDSNSCCK